MKALSVRAPWWWAILRLGKDIENRDWYTNFRGTIYLHAGRWFKEQEIADDWTWSVEQIYTQANPEKAKLPVPRPADLELKAGCGCLVGKVDIVGCVMHSDSPWFYGKHGFVLANPVALAKPIPFKGALGFFEVPHEIEDLPATAAADPVPFVPGILGEAPQELRSLSQSDLWGDPELAAESAGVGLRSEALHE